MKINEIISETIRKVGGDYRLVSRKGKNLGTFPTKAGAQKHEREVQYFKHMNEEVNSEWLDGHHYAKTFRIGNYNYKVENVLHSGDVPGINVTVTDPSRKYTIIGYAYFIHHSDNNNEWLESDETIIDDHHQGMGISSTIYSLVKMLGFSVKPSAYQSHSGREMWNSWKAKGNDRHLAEAGGGHYDMPTKETFMIVISDGTKKRDLVSAESQKKADSIARSLRSKYPDKIVTIEPRKVVAQQYNEESNSTQPGEYVYHASYLPNLARGLKSIMMSGLKPSENGYGGRGVYFAYTPDGGFYHVDEDQATMFRVKWADLVEMYGVYPENKNGIQRDNEEIIVPGPVPADMLELEYFPDEWWDIRTALSSETRQ